MPEYRSRTSTHGRNMAGARALWRATGMKDDDFDKPIIAVANSFTQFVPGHVHLKDMGQLVAREIEKAGGEMLITADHGNAEMMFNKETGQPHTAHTTNPVPFLYYGRDAKMETSGALSDVAPTMLYLMGIEQPSEMRGRSLIGPIEDEKQPSLI